MKCVFLFLSLFVIVPFAAQAGDEIQIGGNATVKIQEQYIFPSPVFYAQPISELSFGAVVSVIEKQGDWYRIKTGDNTEGWVHATALTGAVLSEGSQGTDDSDMIMLAGRGFNDDVEGAYAQGKDLPWDQVDAIVDISVEPSVLKAFLVDGLLIEGGTQ